MKFQTPFSVVPAGLLPALRGRGRSGAAHLRAVELWIELASRAQWGGEYGDGVGACYPTIATLAASMECSRDVVEKASARLKAAGYLTTTGGKKRGRANVWFLLYYGPAAKTRQAYRENAAPLKKVVNQINLTKPPKAPNGQKQRPLTFAERASNATQETGDSPAWFSSQSVNGSVRPFIELWPSKRGGVAKAQRRWDELTPEQRAAAVNVAAVYARCNRQGGASVRLIRGAANWLRDRGWRTDLANICAEFGLDTYDLPEADRARARETLAKFAGVD